MDQSIFNIVTSLLDQGAGQKSSPLKSIKERADLFSSILKSRLSVQPKGVHRPQTRFPEGLSAEQNRYQAYCSSLKKAFLAKGMPFNKASLQRADLPILEKFLYHCGFSQKKVDRFLKDMAENNPGGDINLAVFFQKMSEFIPTQKADRSAAALEPAAIPHIESILRNFGLTPKALEHVFNSAKAKDGRLDLDRLVTGLKEISSRLKKADQVVADAKAYRQTLEKLDQMGIYLPDGAKDGRISLKDFVVSLEKVIGKSDNRNGLSPEVKNIIGQISAKAVVSDVNPSAFTKDEGEPLTKGDLLAPFRGTDTPAQKQNQILSARIKDKNAAKERPGAYLKTEGQSNQNKPFGVVLDESGSLDTNYGLQKMETVHPVTKAELLFNLDGFQKLEKDAVVAKHTIKSDNKTIPIPQHMAGSGFSETIQAAQQNQKPVQNFLPAYLVDQVGRQISRSILRGDRVIKIQVKPPELGIVKIEMDVKGTSLKLAMSTENSVVKELLLSNIHELKEALLEQNVRLEKVDVQISYDFNQTLTNSQQWQRTGHGGSPGFNEDWAAVKDDIEIQ
ncbi:MAG: flagellar hook-length control protein FliK, partial [Proteobacteria bacterium]|nr:flagellar hook-length control protein FliK [Pseudomonadota bacterium]